MATREQIMAALFTVLSGTSTFITKGRRNRDPEGLKPAQTPALFLVEHDDEWNRKTGINAPAVRLLNAKAILYIDTGADENAIPSTFINNALDSMEAAFAPDNLVLGTFTLGGLVRACHLDGTSTRASGDVTGKGLVVVPIRILMP